MPHHLTRVGQTIRSRAPLLALTSLLAGACDNANSLATTDPSAPATWGDTTATADTTTAAADTTATADTTAVTDTTTATDTAAAADSQAVSEADQPDGTSVEDQADDSIATPADTAQATSLAASVSGIPAGAFELPLHQLGTYSGAVRVPSASYLVSNLRTARRAGARVVLSLSGSRSNYTNSDGTFNLSKWKARVDRFRGIDFTSYVRDGTVVGHYLIDEPNCASCWGGKRISQSTVEAAAKYSKSIWPSMATIVRVNTGWLRDGGPYHYLDAAWAQYSVRHGDVRSFLRGNVAGAKALGLGLIMGLNALDGGTRTSGIRGFTSGKYSMSARQLRSFGRTLLDSPYICGFINWKYSASYFSRSDIHAALAELTRKAKNHPEKSCKV